MKKSLLILMVLLVGFLASDAQAQKKMRIGLPEGADSVEVSGRVTGNQFVEYEILVEKGDVWEVALDSANEYIGYTVKDAKGNRYDFLENAPVSGFYKIRVYLNSTGAKKKKPADYTLRIKFEMEKSEPLN